ncbi:hypothetical protein A2U01_0104968, partial [Trifolium medium]|nr:hypothetical protein [Trifolium medium]
MISPVMLLFRSGEWKGSCVPA